MEVQLAYFRSGRMGVHGEHVGFHRPTLLVLLGGGHGQPLRSRIERVGIVGRDGCGPLDAIAFADGERTVGLSGGSGVEDVLMYGAGICVVDHGDLVTRYPQQRRCAVFFVFVTQTGAGGGFALYDGGFQGVGPLCRGRRIGLAEIPRAGAESDDRSQTQQEA